MRKSENNLPGFIILSLSAGGSLSEHGVLQRALGNQSYKTLKSCSGGTEERSYLILLPKDGPETSGAILDIIIALAKEHGQESILIVEPITRDAHLLYINNDYTLGTTDMGKFTQVTEQTALSSDSWIYDPENDQYYQCISD